MVALKYSVTFFLGDGTRPAPSKLPYCCRRYCEIAASVGRKNMTLAVTR